ncbi:hypothetical protein SAMN05216214_107137 [Atopomonas hussainii]|uniref:Uncharacterized protein n=1 Tax=Atopomonas hussainii TaxID=1429083 RepID=A0A1H7LWR8_9GAMM|nr:hypothetical protein [Atopomonas hussainii]SEL02925.1 hypothetical protein SAMN05216214_107137 [Atopomonas hussainii]
MHVTVRPEGDLWLVCFAKQRIRMPNQAAAEQFAEQLRQRLNAPHPWPRMPLAKAS